MGKRFTETTKWADRWFAGLSVEHKLFWAYLCDSCDQAGVWDEPEIQARARMGLPDFDFEKARAAFGDRIEVLSGGAWWLVKFIAFQNPKGLTETANYHKPVFASLAKYGIPLSRVGQELTNSQSRDLDKDKDKDLKALALSDFEKFWSAFPRKVGKGKALESWLTKKPSLEVCLKTLAWQKKHEDWTKEDGRWIPHPTTWLNQSRWLDEKQGQHKNDFKFMQPRQKPEEDDETVPF